MHIVPILPTSTAPDTPPTFADALRAIGTWADLPEVRSGNLASALRSVGRFLGLPLAAIPCDTAWLNERLFQRPPSAFGVSDGRFRNVISLVRAVLRRLGLHAPDLRQLDDLPEKWRVMLEAVENDGARGALTRFGRFCAGAGVAPANVCDAHLQAFADHERATLLAACSGSRARKLAQGWNACVRAGLAGWPTHQLKARPVREPYTLPFTAYPESFQADVARFQNHLSGSDGRFLMSSSAGRRLSPDTVKSRLFSLRQAAGLLVGSGLPPTEFRTLRDLVEPLDRVAVVLNALAERQAALSGQRNPRGSQLALVSETLRQVAVHHVNCDEDSVTRITEWARQAAERRAEGLTPKNRDRLRALVTPQARALLLHLPEELLRRAAEIGPGKAEAARLAFLAVALEIILVCPLRRRSLLALRIDQHLQRLDPRRRRITHLVLQGDDMKNGDAFEWPLPPESAAMLEVWIRDFRPTLAESNNPWLFPGPCGALSGNRLAEKLVKVIENETGVRVHVHLLRHFAAWLYLRANPGCYEDVRRALGHRSLETTIRYYIAFELAAAAERFDATVLRERKATRPIAAARWGKSKRRETKG